MSKLKKQTKSDSPPQQKTTLQSLLMTQGHGITDVLQKQTNKTHPGLLTEFMTNKQVARLSATNKKIYSSLRDTRGRKCAYRTCPRDKKPGSHYCQQGHPPQDHLSGGALEPHREPHREPENDRYDLQKYKKKNGDDEKVFQGLYASDFGEFNQSRGGATGGGGGVSIRPRRFERERLPTIRTGYVSQEQVKLWKRLHQQGIDIYGDEAKKKYKEEKKKKGEKK